MENFVPNQWYAILDPAEVPEGKPVGRRRLGRDLVFWRDASGAVCAAHDRCPHRSAALSLGTVTDGCLTCPFHGFEFENTGACTKVPAHPDHAISNAMRLQTVPLREEHDLVWMWSGPDAPSDAPLPFFDVEGFAWSGSQIQIPWPVHYTRSVENQLDFAHLAFVHHNTIGWMAPTEIDVEVTMEGSFLRTNLKHDPNGGISFIGPNIWKLHLGPRVWNFLAFVPVDDDNMLYILRTYQSFVATQPFSWALGKAMSLSNPIVLGQDRRVVTTQKPNFSSLENGEVYVQSDAPIITYLKWRRRQMRPALAVVPDQRAS